MRPVVEALQCLKGIGFISATVFISELGDLRRFQHPRQLMAFLGLVSCERSSGQSRRQGAITKSGNRHARLFLVEAAHHYRTPAKVSKELSRRQEGRSRRVCAISWQAQNRLHRRLWALLARGVPAPKAIVAVARELCGFIWAVGREAMGPGSVEIRAGKTDPSPKAPARQVEYILRQASV